ncbi:universal stress protein [Thermomonas sp.]|uniref:universal stress protein n=1 Tax=Thermomonas sp. TaxID=1971895 RepID=UPI0024877345|nr:universal stress protein [Thermomonas sp.]MDI1252123.1 universal stress protein [Thermomonas sp.]
MTQSLINIDGRVLAAIDPSVYAASVASLAAWAATHLGAPFELLHVIARDPSIAPPDLSGNLSMDTTQVLLGELAALDEQRAKMAQAHGRELLQQLQSEVLVKSGVTATITQRHGVLVDTLLDLELATRLIVIGKRGEHADFAKGHLGSNLERVVRAVHRPVLVAAREYRPISRFLVAFDGSATTRTCIEMICASPLLRDVECHVLMVGDDTTDHRDALAWAQAQLTSAGFTPTMHLQPGSADTTIARHVDELKADLLVMGAYGHSRIRTMILGSTTTQLLRTCHIPVLLLR